MTKVVEVSQLSKMYGAVAAVDGISLELAAGEIVGLLGPNGAGKTTFVECLLGLRHPDDGDLRLFGIEQGAADPAIRGRIGAQLQTTGLLSQLTVREQVQLFGALSPHAIPADDVLQWVGIEDLASKKTKTLSGGQQQRLAVALALVGDPDLVFLDEPTTGLDPQARRALWEVIAGLRTQGKSVLLTTHYMQEAEQLCDRVVILDRGRLIESGAPKDLIRKYFRETAVEFTARSAADPSKLGTVTGVVQVLFEDGRTILYTADVPRTMAGLFDLAEVGGVTFDDIVIRQATLEDVFLKLAGRRLQQ